MTSSDVKKEDYVKQEEDLEKEEDVKKEDYEENKESGVQNDDGGEGFAGVHRGLQEVVDRHR